MPALERILEDERQPFLHRWDDSGEYRRGSPSPSPSPPPAHVPANKKLYQRTRFAADIPPPSPPPTTPAPAHTPRQHSSGLGDSLRRFVGKFRSASREKRRNASNSSSAPSRLRGQRSRSPSPAPGRRASSRDDSPPLAPRRRERSTQTKGGGSGGSDGNADVDRRPGVQKFYLGEDPFGGSIYGREREYDDVVPARRRHRRRGSQSEEEPTTYRAGTLGRLSKSTSRLTSAPTSNGLTTTSSGTTTVRRIDSLGGRGGVQTLPRKLREDSATRTRRQGARRRKAAAATAAAAAGSSRDLNTTLTVQVGAGAGAGTLTRNQTSSTTHTPARAASSWEGRFSKAPHTGSLINVSFVNNNPPSPPPPPPTSTSTTLTGPAKPARTYRTTLTRSRSFNVQAVPTNFMSHRDSSKSNSQLHRLDRLDEGPEPLKSPKILASISRSQRDLSDAVDKENVDDLYTKPMKKSQQVNGDKRKIFLRGLLDRAPELFRTVHPEEEHRFTDRSSPRRNGVTRVIDYSNSMRASPTNGERGPSPAGPRLSHVSSLRRGSAGSGNIRRGSRDSPEEYVDSDTNSRSRYARSKTSTPSRSRQQSNGSVVIHVRNTRK